jgi:hypothetical protein
VAFAAPEGPIRTERTIVRGAVRRHALRSCRRRWPNSGEVLSAGHFLTCQGRGGYLKLEPGHLRQTSPREPRKAIALRYDPIASEENSNYTGAVVGYDVGSDRLRRW